MKFTISQINKVLKMKKVTLPVALVLFVTDTITYLDQHPLHVFEEAISHLAWGYGGYDAKLYLITTFIIVTLLIGAIVLSKERLGKMGLVIIILFSFMVWEFAGIFFYSNGNICDFNPEVCEAIY